MKKLNDIESVGRLVFAVLLNSGVTINNFRLIGEPLKGTAQPFSKRILFSSELNEWIFSNDKMEFDECIQYSKKEIQDFNEFYWVDKELLRVVKKLLKSIGYNSSLFQVVIIIMYFRNSRKLLKLPNNSSKREHSVARLLELLSKEETCNKNSLIIKSNNLTLFEKFDNETLEFVKNAVHSYTASPQGKAELNNLECEKIFKEIIIVHLIEVFKEVYGEKVLVGLKAQFVKELNELFFSFEKNTRRRLYVIGELAVLAFGKSTKYVNANCIEDFHYQNLRKYI